MAAQAQLVAKALEQFIDRLVARTQLRCFQAIVAATPVDTGFARAGWTPSVGSPDDSGPTERPSDDAAASGAASSRAADNARRAEAIASTYRLVRGAAFVTNPVRYVEFLNQGSSAQAPARFVEQAIAVGIQAAARDLATR